MAIVTGPLHSDDARGKLANALVFIGWKGIKTVRAWVKPANPQSSDQGDRRIILGGTGRSVGKIQAGKVFAQQLIDLALIPNQQSKQSFMVQYIIDTYLANATAYAAQLALLTAHTSYQAFTTAAATLSITEFDLSYATIVAYNNALGLYLIAKAANALGFQGTPYTTNITAWVTVDVNGMINDFTSAT